MKRKSKKWLPVGLAALLIILGSMPSVSSAALIRSMPEGPSLIRLSWTENPGTSVTVTWQDTADAERAWVEYTSGPSLEPAPEVRNASGDMIREREAQPAGHASTLTDGGTQWSAVLAGLDPDTEYQYRIYSSSAAPERPGGILYRSSDVRKFTTPPASSGNLSFAYFGDVQVNKEAEGEFTRWGELARDAYALHPDIRFGIMGGDIVESGISTEQFDMFFDAASSVFSRIPLMAANGNHESNFPSGKPELYLDSFALPENGPEGFNEEFYSFDSGPAHFLVLNSWVYSGEQRLEDADYDRILSWIRQDLRAADDRTWKIAVMHHPLYAVHSDKVSDLVQENWGPVLQEGGVDLLLCGHQHVYCRSLPMTDGLVDEARGITQLMGVSGEKFYSSADETNMERTVYGVPNYQIFHINGNTMEIQCFGRDGQELDYATLSSRHEAGGTGTGHSHFADVADTDWFREAVDWAVDNNVFNGVSGTQFAPEQPMTREMFATVLWRTHGSPELEGLNPFRDVPADSWYTDAVCWASENGLITGYGGGLFGSGDLVTREQIAAILFRDTMRDPDRTELAAVRGELDTFEDRGEISVWAAEAMSWATGTRLINGMGGGRLAPKGLATRAQAAQIMMNYSKN